jgi:hypothetical protein
MCYSSRNVPRRLQATIRIQFCHYITLQMKTSNTVLILCWTLSITSDIFHTAEVPVLRPRYGRLSSQYQNIYQIELQRRNNTQVKKLVYTHVFQRVVNEDSIASKSVPQYLHFALTAVAVGKSRPKEYIS